MNQFQPWTAEEDNVVRSLWPTLTGPQIGAMLGRTPSMIKNRANRLNVTKSNDWTTDHLDFLNKNWTTMTASGIADALGRSKNSVIGKAHRLGLASKSQDVAETPPRKPRTPRQIVELAPTVDIEPLHIAIINLEAKHCRWPYDGNVVSYCGHQVIDGQSFCAGHYRLAYQPVRR